MKAREEDIKKRDAHVKEFLEDWYGQTIKLCDTHYIVNEKGVYYYMPNDFFTMEKNRIEADSVADDGDCIIITINNHERKITKEQFLVELQHGRE